MCNMLNCFREAATFKFSKVNFIYVLYVLYFCINTTQMIRTKTIILWTLDGTTTKLSCQKCTAYIKESVAGRIFFCERDKMQIY